MQEQPQGSFNETPLERREIIDALEVWQTAQEGVDKARDDLKKAREAAQALIDGEELEDGAYRAGRFVVRVSRVPSHYRITSRLAKTKA